MGTIELNGLIARAFDILQVIFQIAIMLMTFTLIGKAALYAVAAKAMPSWERVFYIVAVFLLLGFALERAPRFLLQQARMGWAGAWEEAVLFSGELDKWRDELVPPPSVSPSPSVLVETAVPDTPPTATHVPGSVQYVVVAGDTLNDIAVRYNLLPADIIRANGLTTDALFAGQVLVLPLAGGGILGDTPTPGPVSTATPPPAPQQTATIDYSQWNPQTPAPAPTQTGGR